MLVLGLDTLAYGELLDRREGDALPGVRSNLG